jgi:uncharacterized membrane protein
MSSSDQGFTTVAHRTGTRVVALFVIVAVVGVTTGVLGSWMFAPAVGWVAGAMTFLVWTWMIVAPMGPDDTERHATREDPTLRASHTLLLVSSIASFGAIVLLLVEAGNLTGSGKVVLAALALGTIAVSWTLVHTLFTLRYAAHYYHGKGSGIDFNQPEKPQYTDFAYLAFTIGMTFQVSDTSLSTHAMRGTALQHALVSYVFGVVVLAASVNLISGLAG